MTRLRTPVLAALVWCAVVAVVATLVWAVISRAGEGVVPATEPRADATGALPVPRSERGRPPHTSPGVTLSPRPTRTTRPIAPSTSAPVGPPATEPTGSPSPPASTSPPSAPTTQRRSWNGAQGHVVAECRGRAARLVAAFPNAGWRYTIASRGPGQVTVRFTRTSGDDSSVAVDARCVAGAPHFWLRGDDDGGDR